MNWMEIQVYNAVCSDAVFASCIGCSAVFGFVVVVVFSWCYLLIRNGTDENAHMTFFGFVVVVVVRSNKVLLVLLADLKFTWGGYCPFDTSNLQANKSSLPFLQ